MGTVTGPVLEIQGAAKQFGGTQALRGADLTLHRGEWLALLGPNGAGKTTLIRAIAGRVRLDRGQLVAFGHALDGATDSLRRRIGVVPQEIALYPLLTARENLEVFARLHGVEPADLRERVAWALEWTALGERAAEPVKVFSGGMKRRLNIACGVLHQPEIVLLDEPTVGVDPQSRERIWEMCAQLRKDGASILLTTHQLDEAQKVCDRIVIIDHGRAIEAGTLGELVARTVGTARRVTLALDQPLNGDPGGAEVDGRELHARIVDVAAELPALLARVAAMGRRVEDVRVESPSLQAVFLHLTGRELRE